MKRLIYLLLTLLLLTGSACTHRDGGTSAGTEQTTDTVALKYAQGLSIEKGDGWHKVTVKDPWKPGKTLHTYYLVPRSLESVDMSRFKDGTVVRIPLERTVVYSSVHASVAGELCGSYKDICGVCDAEYFTIPEITSAVKSGKIADCGSSMAPTKEVILSLRPDAILLSPFENGGYGVLEKLGIPIIELADYMEMEPLGRAEWIKFIGLLYGKEKEAESIFESSEKTYNDLAQKAVKESTQPSVVTENVINGVWFVPGGKSYMARLLHDAGAKYVFSDDTSTGSLQLDFAKVFERANDADYWLIKTSTPGFSHKTLESEYALNSHLKAFKRDGGLWACDTQHTTLFNDFPFHPELLLKDYIAIFHPELLQSEGYEMKYYKKITD